MAVSVDTVYQRVLAILNKEQRGYVTPQEFNLFANQAQMDIFEQYFYDINQFGRLHGNDTEYSDMLNILNEKINIFEKNASMTYSNGYWSEPSDLYRMGTIIYNSIEAERINANEYLYINASPLTKPTNDRPIFVASNNGYKVYGTSELTTGVSCNYIKKPAKVDWAYQEIAGRALYDVNNKVDFELHISEETELVYKILQLAGLSIKELQVYQVGNQMEVQNTQQEKA
jgi:hypothetical protein